jgi:hypothetical protein
MYGELILEDAITDAERFEIELAGARRTMEQLAVTAEAAGKMNQSLWAEATLEMLAAVAANAANAFNKED